MTLNSWLSGLALALAIAGGCGGKVVVDAESGAAAGSTGSTSTSASGAGGASSGPTGGVGGSASPCPADGVSQGAPCDAPGLECVALFYCCAPTAVCKDGT